MFQGVSCYYWWLVKDYACIMHVSHTVFLNITMSIAEESTWVAMYAQLGLSLNRHLYPKFLAGYSMY